MTPEEIYHALHGRFGERIVSCSAQAVDPYIVVECQSSMTWPPISATILACNSTRSCV